MAILDTLLHFPKFDVDFGRAACFLGVDLVELVGKRSIFRLKPPPIDRAQRELSKTPIIAFLLLLQAEISRIG